jgi:hypothetical protein
MISLKKNDKIIIIVGVVIIVIACVVVATYQSPKTPETYSSNTSSEKSYDVIWTERNGTPITISKFVPKKSPYEGTVTIPEGNLKSITFNLSWTDDRMTFFKRMGLDSLTLEVTTPDGVTFTETNTSAPITGEVTITYTVVTGIIPPDPSSIKANDEKTAQAKLKEKPYYDDSWSNKNIKINVSVQIGEIRILKKIRDKGNDFELTISYQYYDGTLKEDTTKNTGEDSTPPPDDSWSETPPYISMIVNTGCGRYI